MPHISILGWTILQLSLARDHLDFLGCPGDVPFGSQSHSQLPRTRDGFSLTQHKYDRVTPYFEMLLADGNTS